MINTIDSIAPIVQRIKNHHQTIVLATGFFDLLHQEHINFLKKARRTGDILIIAVESDERARQIKGSDRPHEIQSVRCDKVARYADYVVALPANFNNQEAYESLMAAIRPNIYAVSSHTGHLENKRQLTEKYGGRLQVVHEWNPEISTTKILSSNQNKV